MALVDWPATNVAPALFQLRDMGPFAADGVQFEVLKLRVTSSVPVFLTYIVLVVVLPGVIEDQSTEVICCVRAESL